MNYSLLRSFKKGIFPALGAFLVSQLATLDIDGIMSNPKEKIPAVLLALAVGGLKFLIDVWKQRDMPGNPFYDAPGPPYVGLTVLLVAASTLAGCLTTPPGLGGKTKYSMDFVDTVSEIKDETGTVVAPGQDTTFRVNIAAPAGVDVKDLASMRYRVNPDTGEVDIAVASDTVADTTAQATAIAQTHQMSLDTVTALTPVIANVVAQALVPIPTGGTTPPGPRSVDMYRLLAGLQTIGINITTEQAELLAQLLGLKINE